MPRHKKNVAIHKLEGTYREDRHSGAGYDESQVAIMATTVPACPPTIKTAYAKKAWDSMIPPLFYTKRIAEEDLYILENAFRSLDRAEHYQNDIDTMESDESGEKEFDYKTIMQYAGMVKAYRQQFLDTMTKRFGCSSQDRLAMGKALDNRNPNTKSVTEKMTE